MLMMIIRHVNWITVARADTVSIQPERERAKAVEIVGIGFFLIDSCSKRLMTLLSK
jgi:hypothetical protein